MPRRVLDPRVRDQPAVNTALDADDEPRCAAMTLQQRLSHHRLEKAVAREREPSSDSVDGPGHPRRRRRSPERRRTRGYAQNRQRSISAEPEAEPRGQAEDDGFDNEPPIDGRETEKSSQQKRDPPR